MTTYRVTISFVVEAKSEIGAISEVEEMVGSENTIELENMPRRKFTGPDHLEQTGYIDPAVCEIEALPSGPRMR